MDKQSDLFNKVVDAMIGKSQDRYFFYGGAIRGGKTFCISVILQMLCSTYPGSKWHVVRKDMTVLLATTIPSFEKVIADDPRWKWIRSSGNFHVTYLPTRSKIFFKPESLSTDPELNDFLGLETNGFFLEQIEELSETLWKRAIERAGSWYVPKMPPAFIFSSFNPTSKWIKSFVHDKWLEGQLHSPFCYIQALTTDNKYVTADQWNAWKNMDEASYRNLIEGSWEFDQVGNVFIYSLREKPRKDKKPGYAHIIHGMLPDYTLPLIVSFDFNVEPITALVCQHANDHSWVSILQEYRLMNSDIFELCDRIITDHPGAYFKVTGDASGRNRTAITRGNRNYYYFIKKKLKLSDSQFKLPGANPSIANTRVLCNSLLAKHPAYLINATCNHLLADIRNVTIDEKGDIDKKKDSHKTHLLDCWRYYNWQFHQKFLQKL
ncbi:MAG: hypothetical protein WKF88_05705 [Ferruginibacter sp.]